MRTLALIVAATAVLVAAVVGVALWTREDASPSSPGPDDSIARCIDRAGTEVERAKTLEPTKRELRRAIRHTGAFVKFFDFASLRKGLRSLELLPPDHQGKLVAEVRRGKTMSSLAELVIVHRASVRTIVARLKCWKYRETMRTAGSIELRQPRGWTRRLGYLIVQPGLIVAATHERDAARTAQELSK